MLLKTYGVDIPTPIGDEVDGEVDSVSVDILKRFQPVADGNCLYRAISKVICGNEAMFILLRIFTLLEILSYPMFYDGDHKRFVDLIADNRIVVSTYIQLAKDVGKMGTYASSLSSLINMIKMYFYFYLLATKKRIFNKVLKTQICNSHSLKVTSFISINIINI